MQDPQSLHKYLYVHGDPINRIDPTGEFASLGGTMVGAGIRAGLISMAIGAAFRVPVFLYDVLVGGKELEAALWDLGKGLAFDFAVGALLGGVGAGASRFLPNAVKLRAVGQSIGSFRALRLFGSSWRLGASARGFAIERAILSRAAAFRGAIINNFPVIDDYIFRAGRGIATSIKSLDLTASSYQRSSQIVSRLNSYARSLQNMQQVNHGAFHTAVRGIASANPIDDKILVIALEQGAATGTQAGAIARFLREAATKFPDVKIVLQFVP